MSDVNKPPAAAQTDDDGPKPMTETAFLHKRRGELVIERDRALDALAEMVRCFDSKGDWPYSTEEGAELMDRAVNDAKVVLRDMHHSSAFGVESSPPPKNGDSNRGIPLLSPPSPLGDISVHHLQTSAEVGERWDVAAIQDAALGTMKARADGATAAMQAAACIDAYIARAARDEAEAYRREQEAEE